MFTLNMTPDTLLFIHGPKSHPVRPEEIARAGFICTGQGDKVLCPGVTLNYWECFDIPMDEHWTHFPNFEFMLNVFPKI